MSIVERLKKALRTPDASLSDLRAALAGIDTDALGGEVIKAQRARTALLLNGSEKELDAADAALTRAERERDRGAAAKVLLGERIEEAEAKAEEAALDAERDAVEHEAENVKRALLTEFVRHQAAMVSILQRLEETEEAVSKHNSRRSAAGRPDRLAPVETRAFPVPKNQHAPVYSISRRTSFRALPGAPSWNDNASDFLAL